MGMLTLALMGGGGISETDMLLTSGERHRVVRYKRMKSWESGDLPREDLLASSADTAGWTPTELSELATLPSSPVAAPPISSASGVKEGERC